MREVRVLHLARVINRYDFIDTIIRYLPLERFHLEAATFEKTSNIQSPTYESIGILHHVIPVPHMRAYLAYLKAAYRLAELLRTRQIHLLHTHHFWEGVVGAMAKKLYPRFHLIIHRHYTEDITRLKGWRRKILLSLERWSYRQADVLVVPSRTIREFVQELHPPDALPSIYEIPYGFEFEALKYHPLFPEERQSIRAQYGVEEGTVIIANVGSHRPLKGQRELISAFKQLYAEYGDKVQLWLIGEGPDTRKLQEIAQGLDAGIRFLGWRSGEEVRQLMGAADIIAHPSYSEAFPQVMVEALALERAVVITPVSGAKEYLKHGETAWLVQIGDEKSLYEGLRRLVGEPSLREALGKAGRQMVTAKFHYSVINRAYEKLYTQLCSPSA
ncbi:MAG: glycosyltransferase family 4 protein [Bacteroidia bacterium]|nr:glycosyltransferase family 4 protein [Bacteroidia bacterium]